MSSQNNDEFSIREVISGKSFRLDELCAWQKTGATILGIKSENGEYKFNPNPNTVITRGTKIIAMGSVLELNRLKGLAN